MCGRFSLTSSGRELADHFALREPPELAPRYNIAPGQDVVIVRQVESEAARVLERRRWGFVPAWARDPGVGSRLINARAETAAQRPAFRDAFRRRRCLVPATGFYEWQRRAGRRQPFHVAAADGGLLAIAGLWEAWRGPGGERVESCVLLTTEANACVRPVHDRMPAILAPADYAPWLDPRLGDPERLVPLLRPAPAERLARRPVSQRVNRPEHDDAGCLAPPGPARQASLF